MKKYRKLIAVLCLVVILVSLFTACASKKVGKCELCGKDNVSLKELTYEGESSWLCDDCYDTMKALADMADAFM